VSAAPTEDRPGRADAGAIATAWRTGLDLTALTRAGLGDVAGAEGGVDVVAVGKAAVEMARAASEVLGPRVRRRFIATNAPLPDGAGDEVRVGEHPRPGPGSLAAGRALLSFLDASRDARLTLFLVSGGASSICAAPAAPVTVEDLRVVWDRALARGWDITRLNRARAATSMLGGGAVLRRVRTPRSVSLVMVDNVLDGAPWVASGLTFEFRPTIEEGRAIVDGLEPLDAGVRRRLEEGLDARADLMGSSVATACENRVLVEPLAALAAAVAEARRRGYSVVSMGAVSGEISDVVEEWRSRLSSAGPATCVAGVGEVTIDVDGGGRGGRCQEFALRLGAVLDGLGLPGTCVAIATDGRDFEPGVAGAWADEATPRHLAEHGVDLAQAVGRHDAYAALASLGQLLGAERTGWNLCDLYVVVLDPSRG
jgi:glycerate 2-kinase